MQKKGGLGMENPPPTVFAVSEQQLTYNAHFTTSVILELEFFFLLMTYQH